MVDFFVASPPFLRRREEEKRKDFSLQSNVMLLGGNLVHLIFETINFFFLNIFVRFLLYPLLSCEMVCSLIFYSFKLFFTY